MSRIDLRTYRLASRKKVIKLGLSAAFLFPKKVLFAELSFFGMMFTINNTPPQSTPIGAGRERWQTTVLRRVAPCAVGRDRTSESNVGRIFRGHGDYARRLRRRRPCRVALSICGSRFRRAPSAPPSTCMYGRSVRCVTIGASELSESNAPSGPPLT